VTDPAAGVVDNGAASPAASVAGGVDVSSLPTATTGRGTAPPRSTARSGALAAPPAPTFNGGVVSNGNGNARSSGGAPLPPPGGAPREAALPAATGGSVALPPPPSKATAPAAASSTGNLNVDPKLRAVVVDGSFRRVNDGVLTLSCGQHRIKVGMNDPQVVNVPCGGSVSL
jgi:hypothetical protein